MSEAAARPANATLAAPAGLARRCAALGYEALLLAALALFAGFVTAPFVSPSASTGQGLVLPPFAARVTLFAIFFVLGAWFYSWSWSNGRRTLPMKTWRLALVDASGGPVGRSTALMRYAATWIGPMLAAVAYALLRDDGAGALAWPIAALNWLAAFVDPEQQFLHDRIARTRIIRA